MFSKLSQLRVVDASGAGWVQVFHIYRGFWHKLAGVGDFIKGSVKHVAFYPRYRRGKRYRPLRLGYRVRGLIVHARFAVRFTDTTRIVFFQNTTVLLKRRGLLKTKYNPTLLVRTIRRRQYQSMFGGFI